MELGSFRHKIQLLGRTDSADSYGELVNTYSPSKTVWAARGDVTKKYHNKDAIGIDNKVFTIRYVNDLTSDMRVKHLDVEYRIENIELVGRDSFYVLTLSRVDNIT